MIPITENVGITVMAGYYELAMGARWFSIESTLLISKNNYKHFFEIGTEFWLDDDNQIPTLLVGYRYQAPRGFLFRANIASYDIFTGIEVGPMISVGYSF